MLEERKSEELDLIERVGDEAKVPLERLGEIYNEFKELSALDNALSALHGIYGGSALLAVGHFLNEFVNHEFAKPDHERESSYRERNIEMRVKYFNTRLDDVVQPFNCEDIAHAIEMASAFDELAGVAGIIGDDIEAAVKSSHEVLSANFEKAMRGDAEAIDTVRKDR